MRGEKRGGKKEKRENINKRKKRKREKKKKKANKKPVLTARGCDHINTVLGVVESRSCGVSWEFVFIFILFILLSRFEKLIIKKKKKKKKKKI